MFASLDGLDGDAKASSMVVQHTGMEREQAGRTEIVHADMMMRLFIAHHVIMFGSMKDTGKVS